jgi:hypothetical protein
MITPQRHRKGLNHISSTTRSRSRHSCTVLSLAILLKILLDTIWKITRSPSHSVSGKVINLSTDGSGNGSMPNPTISSSSCISRITYTFGDYTLHPSCDLRISILSNLRLEETVIANNLTKTQIDYQNIRDFSLRQTPAAASVEDDDMMIVVIVVDESC